MNDEQDATVGTNPGRIDTDGPWPTRPDPLAVDRTAGKPAGWRREAHSLTPDVVGGDGAIVWSPDPVGAGFDPFSDGIEVPVRGRVQCYPDRVSLAAARESGETYTPETERCRDRWRSQAGTYRVGA